MKDVFEVVSDYLTRQGFSWFQASVVSVIIIILLIVAVILLYILLYRLIKKITRKIFRVLEKKQGRRIHLVFLEKVIQVGIVVFIAVSFLGFDNLGGSLLGSAAVITGVIGFAAQDVIKDILSGFLISIYKPFDLGDRIELEDGTVGIVESITMRHVVLVSIDTVRVIIPNSRINAASIINYSTGDVPRSCSFRFPVSYESDVEKTKKVIYDTIKGSPYTVPGKKQADGTAEYGPVYFIDLADSALIMAVTVYYLSKVPTEKLKDDIYSRVFEALEKNGIEIPYNYMSVVLKK